VLRLQLLANGIGALVVIAYLRFLFPASADPARTELNLVIFVSYLVALVLIGFPINLAVLRRSVDWVREGRAPTARERSFTFRLPLFETLASLITWVGAAVLFGALNNDQLRVGLGIGLAGLLTCSMLYLLLEGHFRPVFALALAHADLPEGRRDVFPRLMLAWIVGSATPLLAIGLSPVLEPDRFDRSRLPILAVSAVIGGGLVMAGAAVSVSRPLARVRAALRRVEQGDLDVHLPVDDLGELGRLAEGVNDLVAGLREREELRDLFGRQVGEAGLVALGEGGPGRGERRRVTVLFVDLQGYTRYSERHRPEEVVAMLNRFFRVVVAVVHREGGWINKFEGDAALCLFGAPSDQPDHAARALRAAATIPRELRQTGGVLPAGIGVATGEVVAGFVGTQERFEYTVIGDVVNIAARLCDEAKAHPTGVLAMAATVEEAGVTDEWERAGRLRIRGRRERIEVSTPRARRRSIGSRVAGRLLPVEGEPDQLRNLR
jgi:adenylate cyclase